MTNRIRIIRSVLTQCIASVYLVTITSTVASPDWRVRYSELKNQSITAFKSAEIGKIITIVLTIGGTRTGTLAGLSNEKIIMSIAGRHQTFEKNQLTPDSRKKLFAEDYAHIVAMELVQQEKKDWETEQARLRQEQDKRSDEHFRQHLANKRVDEEARLTTARTKAKELLKNAHLVLLDWRWTHAHGYVTVEGQVRNISGQKLKSVEAVAQFYSDDGTFITSDSALIEYNPLMPNQISPFKVIETYNPMMKKATVAFKIIWGQGLTTIKKTDYDLATNDAD